MKATQYSLFVEAGSFLSYADSTLRVAVDINDKLGINRHMFLNTVSVMSIPSDIKLSNVRREFLWVINQQDVTVRLLCRRSTSPLTFRTIQTQLYLLTPSQIAMLTSLSVETSRL